ncbi:MAG TPA: aldo/keto reductase [Burkholderiaceae bacterium]
MSLTLGPIVAGVWRLREWQLDTPALVRWIEQALALGVTSFDHADIYGGYSAEAAFGTALAVAPSLRDRIQIVTKCGIKAVSPARPEHSVKSYDSSRVHVLASVDNSLRCLRTDHIDLLLMHRHDILMEPDALADTFRTLRTAGKVLHFGVSNHTPSQFAMLHRRFPLVTNQFEFSPLHMGALDDGTLEQATDLRLPPMIWSPLAGGRLLRAGDDAARRVRGVLEDLGRAHSASAATMAYAWLRRHPSRPIPITGTGRVEGLREALASISIQLSAEDWYRIWQASAGRAPA